jgi:hypothetical protein
MGAKAYCPACDVETSTIRAGFINEGKCPQCGLSVDAVEQLASAQARGASEELVAKAAAAEVRAQQAEAIAAQYRGLLRQMGSEIERILSGVEDE